MQGEVSCCSLQGQKFSSVKETMVNLTTSKFSDLISCFCRNNINGFMDALKKEMVRIALSCCYVMLVKNNVIYNTFVLM